MSHRTCTADIPCGSPENSASLVFAMAGASYGGGRARLRVMLEGLAAARTAGTRRTARPIRHGGSAMPALVNSGGMAGVCGGFACRVHRRGVVLCGALLRVCRRAWISCSHGGWRGIRAAGVWLDLMASIAAIPAAAAGDRSRAARIGRCYLIWCDEPRSSCGRASAAPPRGVRRRTPTARERHAVSRKGRGSPSRSAIGRLRWPRLPGPRRRSCLCAVDGREAWQVE